MISTKTFVFAWCQTLKLHLWSYFFGFIQLLTYLMIKKHALKAHTDQSLLQRK